MPVLQQNYLPAQLQGVFAANNVDGCIAVQAAQSESETDFLINLAADHSFIKGVVGWVDLRANRVEERLAYFSDTKIVKGWRHIVQAEPAGFFSDSSFNHGIGLLSKYNYTYDILIHAQQLGETIELVQRFPGQKFVLDHAAKPNIAAFQITGWAGLIKMLARHPNVYCKLSGLLSEAKSNHWQAADFKPYLDILFENFGSGRLMFGSDWPVVNVCGSYAHWKILLASYLEQFSKAEQEKIWAGNAVDFYAL